MDALSDVLRVVRLTGGVFLHAEFSAPWCIAARVGSEHCAPALGPASHLIIYHYVVQGELCLRVEGEAGDVLALEAGEVVLLPRNDLHLIGSDLDLPPVLGGDIIQPPKDGGTVHDPPWRQRGMHPDDLRGFSAVTVPKPIR
jgi:hypothetical protein